MSQDQDLDPRLVHEPLFVMRAALLGTWLLPSLKGTALIALGGRPCKAEDF